MTTSNRVTVTCDQCGGKIASIEHSDQAHMVGVPANWWKISFAEPRDGRWNADLCSRRCLAAWIDGWRERPDLKIVT